MNALREDYEWLADDLEEALLAKEDPEEELDGNYQNDRSLEDILKDVLNRGGVPSRPSHHIIRDDEIKALKEGSAQWVIFHKFRSFFVQFLEALKSEKMDQNAPQMDQKWTKNGPKMDQK